MKRTSEDLGMPWQVKRHLLSSMENHDLIKYDPEGKLPLKSGGFTDLYFNLRNARSHPRAIADMTIGYTFLIRKLKNWGLNRFAEIPHGVSCFAGPLATETEIPYITIRETEKEGRVSGSRIIGDLKTGDSVVIIDDVITDGASKIEPINLIHSKGAKVVGIVVLVDREDGWEEMFEKHSIEIPVYSCLTISEVREML